MARTFVITAVTLIVGLLNAAAPLAGEMSTTVAIVPKDTGTYYVPVTFGDLTSAELMLDTGSGYVAINEHTLAALERQALVRFVQDVHGVMADGSQLRVPIYRVAALTIGCCCAIADVEVAVFPGTARQILGLSALRKVSPFAVSLDPPHLGLSQCARSGPDDASPARARRPPANDDGIRSDFATVATAHPAP